VVNQDPIDCLLDAMGQYSQNYDEVFIEVGQRIREYGEAGKLDLAALICWKRSGQGKWVSELMDLPDAEVRAATRKALAATTDQDRLDALAVLPGFRQKYAIATAVLAAHDPENFAVLDWRALKALKRLGWPVIPGRGETLRYLDRVRNLRDQVHDRRPNATARNVDQALWVIGGYQDITA
jgi:hypothetical protein